MKKEKPATKLCKHCKTEIPYDAKICPQCKKKQGMGIVPKIIIIIIALALIGSFASKSDSDTPNGTEPALETPAATESPSTSTNASAKETEES